MILFTFAETCCAFFKICLAVFGGLWLSIEILKKLGIVKKPNICLRELEGVEWIAFPLGWFLVGAAIYWIMTWLGF